MTAQFYRLLDAKLKLKGYHIGYQPCCIDDAIEYNNWYGAYFSEVERELANIPPTPPAIYDNNDEVVRNDKVYRILVQQ